MRKMWIVVAVCRIFEGLKPAYALKWCLMLGSKLRRSMTTGTRAITRGSTEATIQAHQPR